MFSANTLKIGSSVQIALEAVESARGENLPPASQKSAETSLLISQVRNSTPASMSLHAVVRPKFSPPSTEAFTPSSARGIRATPQFLSGARSLTLATFQGPLTCIARPPEMNWLLMSPWVQLMMSLGMEPSRIRSFRKVSASTQPSPFSSSSLPPEDRNHGMNWKQPSSFFTALMPRP